MLYFGGLDSTYVEDLKRKLRQKLIEAVQRHPAQALLLSGGVDSSTLAALCPGIVLFTTTLSTFGSDGVGAERVAKYLQMDWHHKIVEIDEAIEIGIPFVVRISKTFDPGVLNDLPIYFSMNMVRNQGFNSVMTGDGPDEIFAGYSYMYHIEQLNEYIRRRIVPFMVHSSTQISEALGLRLSQPYLDPEIIEFALKTPREMKVRRIKMGRVGDEYIELTETQDKYISEEGELWGKIILIEAFEGYLPENVLWRQRADLMVGSGMYKLEEEIARRITDSELERKVNKYNINWWDPLTGLDGESLRDFRKLQIHLYESFISEFGDVPEPTKGQKPCDYCFAGLPREAPHCSYCGGSLNL